MHYCIAISGLRDTDGRSHTTSYALGLNCAGEYCIQGQLIGQEVWWIHGYSLTGPMRTISRFLFVDTG